MKTLPQITLDAFRAEDYSIVAPYVMTVDRYLELSFELEPGLPPERRRSLAEKAAQRAKTTSESSFRTILGTTQKEDFSWAQAQLESLIAKSTGQKERFEASYSETSGAVRVDALLEIISGEESCQLKIDDCFLVGNRRFIGNGFRLLQ